jgi:hypothetical protein
MVRQRFMDPTCASWVTILSGLLTPVIAIAVAFIAYRQWRTAQNRLRLDLFDRCLAIHTEALEIIAKIVTHQFDTTDLTKFEPAVRRSKWLMDKDLERYFRKEFIPQFVELQVLYKLGSKADPQEKWATFKWIADQEDVLDAKFDRFLKIRV